MIHGDALASLETLPLGFADCIVTDPPYGETSLGWDRLVAGWPSRMLPYLSAKGSMWVFGSLRSHLTTRDAFVCWRLAQDVIWEKHNGSSSANDRFRRVHEIAVHWYPATVAWADLFNRVPTTPDAVARTVRGRKRPPHWGEMGAGSYVKEDGGPRLMRSVIYCRSEHGRAEHPTQKPTSLLEHLIECSCPPGGVVFDPFAGSGSTGVAAVRSGRSFVGIEQDASYVAIAERRLDAAIAGLFGGGLDGA